MQVKLLKDVEYVGKKDEIVMVNGAAALALLTDKLAREVSAADVTALDNVRTANHARVECGMDPIDPKPKKSPKVKAPNGQYEALEIA